MTAEESNQSSGKINLFAETFASDERESDIVPLQRKHLVIIYLVVKVIKLLSHIIILISNRTVIDVPSACLFCFSMFTKLYGTINEFLVFDSN